MTLAPTNFVTALTVLVGQTVTFQ